MSWRNQEQNKERGDAGRLCVHAGEGRASWVNTSEYILYQVGGRRCKNI